MDPIKLHNPNWHKVGTSSEPDEMIWDGQDMDFAGSDGVLVTPADGLGKLTVYTAFCVNGLLIVTLASAAGVETCVFPVKEHGQYVLDQIEVDPDDTPVWVLVPIVDPNEVEDPHVGWDGPLQPPA